jgi:ATP-grasp domain, R2K clade family 2
MISKAFIQSQANSKLRLEEQLIVEGLDRRGVPVTYYTEKRIRRRQLPLDRQSLVVGDMPCIFGALQQLAIPEPLPNDYPASLSEFLHRRVWRSTLEKLEFSLREGICSGIFAKPANRCKRFKGCVFDSEYDLFRVYGVSRQEVLLCAEVVRWLSEYRIYVVNSEIRSVDWYAGDREVAIDLQEVGRAINALDIAGESYAGYAIDFGVLATGETALVEMNDGFAIGAYQIDSKNYTDLIWARWAQLLSQP